MGNARTRSPTPDLFPGGIERPQSLQSNNSREDLPAPATEKDTPSSTQYALPRNLPNALGHLDDEQLEQLHSAVIAEQKRRGKALPELTRSDQKSQVEAVTATLPQGNVKAIRAAFKAGVKPSQIARHFRVSQSDVRKVLWGKSEGS